MKLFERSVYEDSDGLWSFEGCRVVNEMDNASRKKLGELLGRPSGTISSQAQQGCCEGSTTRTNRLEQMMKSVGPSGPKCPAPERGEDIVSSAWQHAAVCNDGFKLATWDEDIDYLGGFGIVHTLAPNCRILKWDSQT